MTTSLLLSLASNVAHCGKDWVTVPVARGVMTGGTVVTGLSAGGRSIINVLRYRVPSTNAFTVSVAPTGASPTAFEIKDIIYC